MFLPSLSPLASRRPQKLADWLEIKALLSPDGNASQQDLVAELRRNGSTDALQDDIRGLSDSRGELSEMVADDSLSEISDRAIATGEGYPFEANNRYLQLDSDIDVRKSTYLFLLLVSVFGPRAVVDSSSRPDRSFEDISVDAARNYLCHRERDDSYLFAFPRRSGQRSFPEAVNRLSILLGEGGGINRSYHPKARDQKDAFLDLVVWRGFPDCGPGQLIAFGHCAAGKDWRSKAMELPAVNEWCTTWMRDPPSVLPVRMFFIPHRPDREMWKIPPLRGQILFDRCRIAYHTPTIPADVQSECAKWIEEIIDKLTHAVIAR